MIEVKKDIGLSGLSTMMTGGVARCVIEWETEDDLRQLVLSDDFKAVRTTSMIPVGQGSNLLFVSDEYKGTLLKCTSDHIELVGKSDGKKIIKADAGVMLDDLVAYACRNNYWGLENLSLIPGTVGGAAVQNVGAYGAEFKDVVLTVNCFDLETGAAKNFEFDEIEYGYRDSIFKRKGIKGRFIVMSVIIELSTEACPRLDYGNLSDVVGCRSADILAIREAVISLRRSKLPEVGVVGSAGSFFKNPVVSEDAFRYIVKKIEENGIDVSAMPVYNVTTGKKLSAAWLIDKAGWKGVVRRHAGVWARQPLVLVNADGEAQGVDIAHLATDICHDIEKKFGVLLQPEVEYLK